MKTPPGWRLVPENMTLAMLAAAKGAIKEYLDRLPAEQKAKINRRHGIRVGEPLKYELRYRAALAAAPKYEPKE